MNKYYLSFIILGIGVIISGILIGSALAQTGSDIQYPVKELGNCQNEASCRTYCDKPENIKVCVNFAEKNNLMSQEELQRAKKFIAAGTKGPGSCAGKDSCEEYCNDISHIDECVSFAEKNNLMPPEQLGEAKKVQAAIKRGVKPPPCGNKNQCDVYCSEADHMEECITFGVEAGFIQGKELEDSQKMLAAIKKGVKPPPCKGKEGCDQYCQNPDNMEVCMNFAIAAGFMSDKEKEDSQKVLQAVKKGVKPPACKGKEECDNYCGQESHFEECTKFAEAAGFMSPQEAEMARKTGGKGPGDCKGKGECESFCNNPSNQETCFNFAKENGMIPQEDLQRMEEGKQQFKEALTQTPPEVLNCLDSSVGVEQMDKFKSGAAMPPREIGDKMQQCFEKFGGPAPGGPGGQSGPGGASGEFKQGPGGCKSPDECNAYCESHQEECKGFGPTGQMGPQGQATPGQIGPGNQPAGGFREGPGGCKSPEECKNFAPTGQQGQQPPMMETQGVEMQKMMEGIMPKTMEGTNFQKPPEGTQPMIQPGIQTIEGYQPPQPQQPFMSPTQPQPPAGYIAPPPAEGTIPTGPITPPPPSSAISPHSLIGLIFGIFNLGNR